LEKTGTILNVVNQNPLRKIKHAAIIGSDNKMDDFVWTGIKEFAEKQGRFTKLVLWFAENRIQEVLQQVLGMAQGAYTEAMQEAPVTTTANVVTALLRDFARGVSRTDARYDFQVDGIQPLAHDFVVPAAYQLIEKQSDAFLGNWVNSNASHLSGADPRDKVAGGTTQRYILDILEKLA
jgi:hypothetical protein